MRHTIWFGLLALVLGTASMACTTTTTTTTEEEEEFFEPTTRQPRTTFGAKLAEDAAAPTETTETTDPAPTSTDVDAGAQAPAGPCVTDSDCTTYSSFCAADPCECFGQRRGTARTCPGKVVNCFKDPCLGKAAVCVAGQCVL